MLWFVDFVAASLVLFIIVAVKSSSGVRALDVATRSGFAFTAIADRGLDVAAASYEGITLAWRSRNGIASPAYYEPQATCGLTIFGPSGSDQWGSFGLHGRIDATPAEDVVHHVRWEGDECILEIRGRIRQILGEDLVLERCLRTTVGGSHLEVHDTVTNEGGKQVPHMLLYHCNGGFPLLDESSELHVSQSSMRPRDAGAEKGLKEWNRGGQPASDFAEQVFIHDPVACADGRAAVLLHNAELREGRGLAFANRFDPAQLPALFTWRMLGYGTYVMGIEPANCPTIEGRVKAEQLGTLPFLDQAKIAGTTLNFTFERSRRNRCIRTTDAVERIRGT